MKQAVTVRDRLFWEGERNPMKVNDLVHGFRVLRVREFEELGGRLWEMEHEKTGAKLCWLDRPDENKAFSIAFKTLPEDSTGVFHILEHSVLCGSEKYPVKEPFVELLKSSVQTFLNAVTYPDKTVYPVSSRNDRDFLNLVDVYLDAVLHPAIYQKPEIFRQEGWRYENVGETPGYQGVVLNEMKGAFSDPGTLLGNTLSALLLPDTCYRCVSGGDPEQIPDLSYAQFLSMHRKYYHPSNAFVSLVGSVPLESVLEKLDGFFAVFDRRDAAFRVPMQTRTASAERRLAYQIGPDEGLEERTVVACGTLLGAYNSREQNCAAAILADYLAGNHDAPLKRAILDAGLGQDMGVGVRDGIQQSWFSWEVWNTDAEKLPEIRRCVRDTVEKITEDGLDPEALRACYNQYAFRMRDRDSGSYPRSVAEALDMLDTWLYGGDPAEGLLVEDVLRSLEEKLETDYYLDLLRELFLPERPSAVVVLTPSHTVGAEKAQREAARIAAARASWTEAEREAMIRQEEDLAVWQQTPDPPEALATIPMLRLSDLNDRPEPLPMTVKQRGTTTLLYHETGSGLAWLRTFLNVSDLLPEELPLLSLLAGLLGILPTARHDAKDLQVLIKQTVGALEFQPVVYAGSDPDHCRVIFAARTACLPEQAERAAALLTELLTETVFRDRGLLRDVLKQTAMDMQMSLSSMGQQFALTRVSAAGSAHGAAREYLGGIAFADWIKTQSAVDDEALDRLLLGMETIARRSFRSERLTVSCSELVSEAALEALAFPSGEPCTAEAGYGSLGSGKTFRAIPSDVGFAAMGTNLRRHGRTFSGCLPVLANLLNYTFLWNEIRVQGGAYGCGFQARDDGDAAFHTYRDPQPDRSLEVMKQAASFLRDFCAEQPDLTGFILSAVSTLDPLLNTVSRMDMAEHRWFKGSSREDVCQCYRQLLHTTPEDLLDLSGMLEELASDETVCILAGTEQLNGRTQSSFESGEEA